MRKVVRHYSTCRTGSSNPVTDIAAGVAVGYSRHATKASAQHAAAVLQFSNTQSAIFSEPRTSKLAPSTQS
jgi:hypothetical protein